MEGGKVADAGQTFEAERGVGDALPSTTDVNSGGSTAGGPQQQQQRAPRNSRRNKKTYRYVDFNSFREAETAATTAASGQASAPGPKPNAAPAEYRAQVNGVPPMATRNSEYAPVTAHGQSMHKTFGNMFQSISQRPKNFAGRNEFAMKDDEFPTLK